MGTELTQFEEGYVYVVKDTMYHTMASSGIALTLTLALGLCSPGVLPSAKGHGLLCV